MAKPIIYQLIPRLFTNYCASPVRNGSIIQNGSGKLNAITPEILKQIKALGVSHVWYTGVIEHAHVADYTRYGIKQSNPHVVKGRAGSPYAITDYYDIDPDLSEDVEHRMQEFEALVKRTHQAGMKVIIDFVPNHVGREYSSDAKPRGIRDLGEGDDTNMFFSPRNNFYYITRQKFSPIEVNLGEGKEEYVEFPAKASGNDCFTAYPGKCDWYDTVKLNYGVDPWNGEKRFDPIPPTWFKMLHILRYWAAKGVDGFRCDMAHMVPLEFWHWAISLVRDKYPQMIFIAEIYDVNLYRPFIEVGGFDYLYDKVTLYDTLFGIDRNNVSAANITSCWQSVEGISSHMLNFLENHDEVRYASPFYAGDANKVIAPLVVSSMINTGAMMIYAGQELGEDAAGEAGYSGNDGRTTIFDYWVIPTIQKWLNGGKCDSALLSADELKLRDTYAKILHICKERAITEGDFFDLMYVNYDNPDFDPHKHYAFIRRYANTMLLIAVNFGNTPDKVKVNIPQLVLDMYDVAPAKYRAKELISDQTSTISIDSASPISLSLPAYGAVIWKFNFKNQSSKQKNI